MKTPCMVIVKLIVPAIRGAVARKLIEEYGLSQVDVAKKLQLTRAAVTQYLKGLRGAKSPNAVENLDEVRETVEKIARGLVNGEINMISATKMVCEVCKTIRSKRLICNYCIESAPSVGKDECDICCG